MTLALDPCPGAGQPVARQGSFRSSMGVAGVHSSYTAHAVGTYTIRSEIWYGILSMNGSLQALQDYLHAEVPLVQCMGVSVVRYDDAGILLAAPLEPNRNYRGTAFAGSLATLVTLAGWALTHLKVQEMGLKAEAAASESHIDFLKPVTVPTIEAFCPMPAPDAVDRLQRMLLRRGMGRWELSAQIRAAGELAVAFTGKYAVTAAAPSP